RAFSFQSSKVSRALSYPRRRSRRICLPGLGASNIPTIVPAPNPIRRNVIAVLTLPPLSYLSSPMKTPQVKNLGCDSCPFILAVLPLDAIGATDRFVSCSVIRHRGGTVPKFEQAV